MDSYRGRGQAIAESWVKNKAQQCTKSEHTHVILMQIFLPLWYLAWLGLRKGTQLSTVGTDYPIVSRLRADRPGLLAEHIFSKHVWSGLCGLEEIRDSVRLKSESDTGFIYCFFRHRGKENTN